MMSAKLATTGLLKIKVFWNKSFDVITSVNDVTKKFNAWLKFNGRMWSCGQSLVTLPFLWEKLSWN